MAPIARALRMREPTHDIEGKSAPTRRSARWLRAFRVGERGPHDPPAVDEEVIERLFDPRRDPDDRVRDDYWFAPAGASPEWRALFLGETVAQRRRWYLTLKGLGRL
jgi:hypothetical protein